LCFQCLRNDLGKPYVGPETYKRATKMTSGITFYAGSGMLDTEVLEEVQRRHDLRLEKKTSIDQKKKKAQRKLKKEVSAIKRAKLDKFCKKTKTLARKKFESLKAAEKKHLLKILKKLTVAELKLLCRWYKRTGDNPIPSTKEPLLARYIETMRRDSPAVSPAKSDDEGEEEDGDGKSVDSFDSDATPPADDDIVLGGDTGDGELEKPLLEGEEAGEDGKEEQEKEQDEEQEEEAQPRGGARAARRRTVAKRMSYAEEDEEEPDSD